MRTTLVMLGLVLIIGCNREAGNPPNPPNKDGNKPVVKEQPPEPVHPLVAELKGLTPVDPVDPAKLETLLPEKLPGYSMVEPSSATTDYGGLKYSFARKKY